jgi:hypothetical protein
MRQKKNTVKHGFKKMKCKYCNDISDKVDIRATARTCWRCTAKLVNGQILEISK